MQYPTIKNDSLQRFSKSAQQGDLGLWYAIKYTIEYVKNLIPASG